MKEEVIKILKSSIEDYNLEESTSIKFSPKERVTYVDYLNTSKKDVEKIIVDLDDFFLVNYTPNQKQPKLPKLVGKTTRIKLGEKSPKSIVSFRSYTKSGKLPTEIHEWGSSYVMQRALRDNVEFNSKEDIENDEVTYNTLRNKIFFNYQDKLDKWIYTYFQQQKQMLKKYAGPSWDEFMYNDDSFVDFFSDYIKDKKLFKDFGNPEKGRKPVRVMKYTEWNPADIYAAKGMGGIKKKLNSIFQKGETGASLGELNSYLIRLIDEKKLVGISLKQIKDNARAILEVRNTKSTFKDPHIEDKNFTMSDIKFYIDNIHIGGTVSTYIKFGKSFGIDVVSSSSDYANLSYSTQITGAAAQGGNSPVAFVNDLMREMGTSRISFMNNNSEYPRTNEEFLLPKLNAKIKYTDEHYETWFNFLKKYFKVSDNNSKNYDSFSKYISMLYQKGKVSGGAPAAQTKLMQLHFYYDTLSNFSRNEKFWLRMLYLGMKVGDIFAPHAKIY